QIRSVALEDFVLFHMHDYVEVARRSALLAGVPVPDRTQASRIDHARRNFQFDAAAALGAAFSGAFAAGIGDRLARASARRTGLLHLEKATAGDDLTDSAAGGTLAHVGPPAVRSAARAGFAGDQSLDFEFFFHAHGRL